MTGYSTKTSSDRSIDRSIDLCVLQDACHAVFEDFYASGTLEAELTKSLLLLLLSLTELVSFSIKFKFGDPDVV